MDHPDGCLDATVREAPWARPALRPADESLWATTALDASGDARPDAAADAARPALAAAGAEK
jgi:hypothetical protein